jgi:uncharacterized protein YjgD (DUF1641 family)
MAASPAALSAALAQSAAPQANSDGEAREFVDGGAGATRDVDGNAYRILGTTRDEAMSEVNVTSANTESGPFREYQHEVQSNNLEGAAKALAAVSNRPITQELVNELNATLGLETTLTTEQLAKRAAALQDPESVTMGFLIVDPSYGDLRALNTNTRHFNEYENAMVRGNLDAAANALAEATDRPITEDLVNYVNRDLGVESNLTSTQVAKAASEVQVNN